jgi:hypothetical protein
MFKCQESLLRSRKDDLEGHSSHLQRTTASPAKIVRGATQPLHLSKGNTDVVGMPFHVLFLKRDEIRPTCRGHT